MSNFFILEGARAPAGPPVSATAEDQSPTRVRVSDLYVLVYLWCKLSTVAPSVKKERKKERM
jgi:hypothetical protein